MVKKLRLLLGRVDIRVLILLVCGFLLAGLALAVAQLAKSSSDEDYSNHLWLSIQRPAQELTNQEIAAHIPGGFTNRIEVFACTNLIDFWWTLAATNLVTEGTDTVYWTYKMMEEPGPVFVTIGNADIDSDGDGIKDAREKFLYHTNPELSDTDGDGLPDGWEIANGFNPLSAQGDDGGAGDPDQDGLSNLEEYGVGANPWQYDTVIILGPDDLYQGGMMLLFGPGRGIQYRSLSTVRSKYGFAEYANPSTPPRYYLSDQGLYREWHNSDLMGPAYLGVNDYYWASRDALTGTYGGSNVTVWTLVEWDTNSYPIGCRYETYTNGYGGATWDNSCSNWPTCEIGQTTIHKFYHDDGGPYGCFTCSGWDPGGTDYWEEQCDRTLSDEYTTPMLLANAADDFTRCGTLTDLDWGEGRTWNSSGCETGSAATAALRDLSTNENQIALTKIGYRFRVANLQPGQIYRLNWAECFTPEGGSTATVLRTRTAVIRGSGGIQFIGNYVIDPPYSDGVTEPVVFKVESITPDSACHPQELDDQDGNPKTRIFLVPVTNAGEVTVTADISPDLNESTLPACMTLQGGNGSAKLTRTVSRTTPSKTVFTFDFCGMDSGLRTTLYLYDARIRLFADHGTRVWEWPWDFNVGHAWWGAAIDTFAYEVVPQEVHNYANELGGFWPQQYGDPLGQGEVRLDTEAGGLHGVTGSKQVHVSFDHFINALAFFKEMYELPSTYDFFNHNCTDVAVQEGEHGEIYTIDTFGVTTPRNLSDWLNSN